MHAARPRLPVDPGGGARPDDAARSDGFAELVRSTQAAVWRLCSALGSPGEVEDLVQETYARAFRGLAGYRGDASPQVWVLAIARRACADHVRRRQRQRQLLEEVARQPLADAVGPHQFVDDVLATLHPDRREAFVLTQYVGLTYAEAAAVIGCPIGTVRSRVARARDDLVQLERRAETA